MRKIFYAVFWTVLMFGIAHTASAQVAVEDGVTSIGKEVNCTTVNPSTDMVVDEHGRIVTHPRLTNNGKIISTDCGCTVTLDCMNCTDTVNCVSITIAAPILEGDVTSAVLQVFSDAAYTSQVGGDITAFVVDGGIVGSASNLNCNTRYYLRLKINGSDQCVFDWTDSTRDMTLEIPTTCDVKVAYALEEGQDRSHEHAVEGTLKIDSVYDHQGNAYSVVQIGSQCWLKENMRATTSPRQETINLTKNDLFPAGNFNAPYFYFRDTAYMNTYGCLYNFNAAIDTNKQISSSFDYFRRGICPKGWHVPSDQEFIQLEVEVLDEMDEEGLNYRGKGSGRLTGSCLWAKSKKTQTGPGNYSFPYRNSSLFSALPSGRIQRGNLAHLDTIAFFWAASLPSSNPSNNAWSRYVNTDTTAIGKYAANKVTGHAVRCVRDVVIPTVSLCEDLSMGQITLYDIENAVKVELVSESDVVLQTIVNPVVDDAFTGLASDNYTVRAISRTSDTAFVEASLVATLTHCTVNALLDNEVGSSVTQLDSVKDHQGNAYSVVQIGNQCWLKENMRATTSPSLNCNIVNPTGLSGNHSIDSYWARVAHWYNNDSTNYAKYGLLYNWCAAVDTNYPGKNPVALTAGYGSPWPCAFYGPRRGICPKGWHIPTVDEFIYMQDTILKKYYPDAPAQDWKGRGWKAEGTGLASMMSDGCSWKRSTTGDTNSPSDFGSEYRNISQFSAVPAGYFLNGHYGDTDHDGFYSLGEKTAFYSANQESTSTGGGQNIWWRGISNINDGVQSWADYAPIGRSVRCIRDVNMELVSNTEDTIRICANEDTSVTYTVKSNILLPQNFVWKVNNTDSLNVKDSVLTVKYDQPGEYVVSYSIQLAGLSFSGTVKTVVVVGTAPQFVVGTNEIFGTAKVAWAKDTTSVKWYDADDNLVFSGPKVYDPDLNPDSSAVFKVVGTAATGCTLTKYVTIRKVVTSCPAESVAANEYSHVDENGITLIDSLADNDNHNYRVVRIGTQCWMRQNLRTTKDNSDNTLTEVITPTQINYGDHFYFINQNDNTDYRDNVSINPENTYDTTFETRYGLLYTWPTASKVCPSGWHLPTYAELATMYQYVYDNYLTGDPTPSPKFNNPQQNITVGSNTSIAAALAGGHDWRYSSADNAGANYEDEFRDVAHLCIVPASCWYYSGANTPANSYSAVNDASVTWTATYRTENTLSIHWDIYSHMSGIQAPYGERQQIAGSVRCVRNTTITPCSFDACGDCRDNSIVVKEATNIVKVDLIKDGSVIDTKSNPAVKDMFENLVEGEYTVKAYSAMADVVTLYFNISTPVRPCAGNAREGVSLGDGRYANKEWSNADGINAVSDHEGNVYKTVQIGNQCWLAENMRATTSPTSHSYIVTTAGASYTGKQARWYSNDSITYAPKKYGLLYNWPAAMDIYNSDYGELSVNNTSTYAPSQAVAGTWRGICPDGWHLPSAVELDTLVRSLSSIPLITGNGERGDAAARLAISCDWTISTVANAPGNYSVEDRNSSGFSAVPAGSYEGSYKAVPTNAYFWSSTQNSANAYRLSLTNNLATVNYNTDAKNKGRSVRCVRDVELSLSNIKAADTTCSSVHLSAKMVTGTVGNNVDFILSSRADFADTVARGVGMIQADSTINADVYNLKTNTKYYVKAVNVSTNFSTQLCACDVAKVRVDNEHVVDGKVYEVQDVDGNWYGVVQIGGQCWLRENMRCTTSPKSTHRIVTNNDYYSTVSKSAKWYNNDSTLYAQYGLLYNACAALDVTQNATVPELAGGSNVTTGWAFSADTMVQGICPAGWHLPTDTEWTRMENYIVSGNHYNLDFDITSTTAIGNLFGSQTANTAFEGAKTPVAPMLAYLDSWMANTTNLATASADTNRNKVQFEAKAAGWFANNKTAANIDKNAYFWTATPSSNNMFCRQLQYSKAGVVRTSYAKSYAFSVRCLRDKLIPKIILGTDDIKGTARVVYQENADTIKWYNTSNELVCTMKGLNLNETKAIAVAQNKDSILSTRFVYNEPGTYKVVAISTLGYTTSKTVTIRKVVTNCELSSQPLSATEFAHEESGKWYLDSIADNEGNNYLVVQIGNQCWMRQNIKSLRRPKTGAEMPLIDNSTASMASSYSAPTSFINNSDKGCPDFKDRFGVLYNWPAAADTNSTAAISGQIRGICPEGWHLPTDAEFNTMFDSVLNMIPGSPTPTPKWSTQNGACEGTNTKIATALAGGHDWKFSTTEGPGSEYESPYWDIAHFSALPARSWESRFSIITEYADFWTATQSTTNAWRRGVVSANAGGYRILFSKTNTARSVRCLRDVLIPTLDACGDQMFGEIKLTGGTNIAKVEVFNSNGVVVKTINNPVTDTVITGLESGNYRVRATSSSGDTTSATANVVKIITHCKVNALFDNERGATTTLLDSVEDHQHNWYEVVQIGDQCWLKENMRCTTSPSTLSTILVNSDFVASGSSKCAAYFDYKQAQGAKCGVLYNWCAAVDTFYNDGSEKHPELAATSGHVSTAWSVTLSYPRRGICPQGWHIPTDAEWLKLEKEVIDGMESLTEANPGTDTRGSAGLGRFAVGCDWIISNNNKNTAPGNYDYADRNSSGFSALPVGDFYSGTFRNAGDHAYFWSSTPYSTGSAWSRNFYYNYEGPNRKSEVRNSAFSVRCLRDVLIPKVVLCGECVDGTIQLKVVENVDSCALLNNSKTFVASKLHPEVDYKFTDLQPGKYYVVSTSSSKDVSIDSVSILSYEHIPCFGTAHNGVEIASGVYANKEWGHVTDNINYIDSVSDHEGNVYKVVQIGNQCWLRENMRCTTAPAGTVTLQRVDRTTYDDNIPYYYVTVDTVRYGFLYNYPAAMAIQGATPSSNRGICPEGWHVPTDGEWTVMENLTLGITVSSNIHGTGLGRLVAGCDWKVYDVDGSYPGNYLYEERELYHFDALPAGTTHPSNIDVYENAFFYTSTPINSTEYAYMRAFYYDNVGTYRNTNNLRSYGRSVRCLRNATAVANTSDVTCTSMKVTAKTIGLGTISTSSTYTSVKAYTTPACTGSGIAATIVVSNDTVKATFSNNLNCNTRYYIKVIAGDTKSSAEIVVSDSTRDLTLGNTTSCAVASPRTVAGSDQSHEHIMEGTANQIDSVYDHEGNRYAVVQIGDQCWLKENMRCKTSPSTGSEFFVNTKMTSSYSSKCASYFNNDLANGLKNGVLYNWCAAVDTFYAAGSQPELATDPGHTSTTWTPEMPYPRRGICPAGWHIPTDDEWITLEDFVETNLNASNATANTGVRSATGLGRLAGGCDWTKNTTSSTAPGYYAYAERNSSGFSALPVGNFSGTEYHNASTYAFFWSSTPYNNTTDAWAREFKNSVVGSNRTDLYYYNGISVRCLRDN